MPESKEAGTSGSISNKSYSRDAKKSVKAGSAEKPALDDRPEPSNDLASKTSRYRNLSLVEALIESVAHDFNNALTSIMHNVYASKMFLENDAKRDEVACLLNSCMKTVRRSTNLTQRLLSFSSGGKTPRKSTYLKNIIKDSAKLALRDSNVEYELNIPDGLWPASADEAQIERAISNLVVNAREATPEGGVIELSAENIVLGNDDVLPLGRGRYVKISVKDASYGAPAKYLRELFDPNPEVSIKGNSLALADVYLIVRNHGGHIDAESVTGDGVTFHVYLPASDESDGKDAVCGKRSSSGRILVMDDDEDIRDSMGTTLTLMGYETVFVIDGYGAIKAYGEAIGTDRPFDAVLMDLAVPSGKGGLATARALKILDPEVKVIIVNGYSEDPVMTDYKIYGIGAAIEKPHSVESLGRVLNNLIATPKV